MKDNTMRLQACSLYKSPERSAVMALCKKCATVAFILVVILISELCAYGRIAAPEMRDTDFALQALDILAITFLSAFTTLCGWFNARCTGKVRNLRYGVSPESRRNPSA